MYSLTKEQLRQLTDPKVKEWFPEVFEVNLEVGKWYDRIWKDGNRDIDLFLISDLIENKFIAGEFFRNNERLEEGVGYRFEAVRRGFVEVVRITPMFPNGKDYYPDKNIISRPLNFKLKGNIFEVDGGINGYRIFVNGKWATVNEIKKMTKIEIEKIID